jgi:hypothetical protein
MRFPRLRASWLNLAAAALAASVPWLQGPLPPSGRLLQAPGLGDPPGVRLTHAGCCAYPAWSSDSQHVQFLDKPAGGLPSGIYQVDLQGGEEQWVGKPLQAASSDGRLKAVRQGQDTVISDAASGQQYRLRTSGGAVMFSPNRRLAAWQVTSQIISHPELRRTAIWIAELGGAPPRQVVALIGGRLVGWTGDSQGLLFSGRLSLEGPAGIWRASLSGSAPRFLWRCENPRGLLLSPDGEWLAFYSSLEESAGQNGIRLLRTDGIEVRRVEPFGGYRWRDNQSLLVIPFSEGSGLPGLIQIRLLDMRTSELLPGPPLPVASNDWSVSPDGRNLVYVAAEDRSLRLVQLGE